MEDSSAKQPRFDEAAPQKRHSKPESPIVAVRTPSLQALPNQVLEHIVRQVVVVVEGHRSGLRILPLVSRTLLRRLQDLSLAVGHLRGVQALSALQLRRLAADGKRAWGLHTLDLGGTGVTDVSALAGCASLHTLDLCGTEVTDVSALAGCSSLHTLELSCTEVMDVSMLVGCASLHTLYLRDTRVTDVSALAGCSSLHTLDLCCTDVTDVTALAGCASLHTLDLSGTGVTDVSALPATISVLKH